MLNHIWVAEGRLLLVESEPVLWEAWVGDVQDCQPWSGGGEQRTRSRSRMAKRRRHKMEVKMKMENARSSV